MNGLDGEAVPPRLDQRHEWVSIGHVGAGDNDPEWRAIHTLRLVDRP